MTPCSGVGGGQWRLGADRGHMWASIRDDAMRASVPLGCGFPPALSHPRRWPPWTACRACRSRPSLSPRSQRARTLSRIFCGCRRQSGLRCTQPCRRYSEPADHRGAPSPSGASRSALRLFVPTPCILSGENTARLQVRYCADLVGLRAGEEVVIRWALRPGSARGWQGRRRTPASGSGRSSGRGSERRTRPGSASRAWS